MRYLYKFSFKLLPVAVIVLTAVAANAQNSIHAIPATSGAQYNFTSFTPQHYYKDKTKLLRVTPAKYIADPDFGKSFIGKRFEDSAQWYERINKRTLKSRTYVNINDTAQILLEYGYDNLNYTDKNGWLRAVDTKLKPSSNGWSVEQQETPAYLYYDASTALSLGNGQVMTFNKNVKFSNSNISTSGYTVGDDGMYIKNSAPNTDKIIRFGRNGVETDYRINKPLLLNKDLTISEDIILPPGYVISENNGDDAIHGPLVVKSADGKVAAEIKTPLCYDNKASSITGSYRIQKQAGGYRLELNVPSAWLNDASRHYPVTIDPEIIGLSAEWLSSRRIGSCFCKSGYDTSGDDTGTIFVTIPPKITITDFWVQVCGFAIGDSSDSVRMWFTDGCNDSIYTLPEAIAGPPTYIYLFPIPADFITEGIPKALNCFFPSCSPQTIPFELALVRMSGGSGCDDTTTYFYYDPFNNLGLPFEAYVGGYYAENFDSAGAGWAITPNPACGNTCTLLASTTTQFGVPPYTISHPWAASSLAYGKYDSSTVTSQGTAKLTLNIPGCPQPVCSSTTVTVPPPVVVDACGDTVHGLSSITLTLNPVPDVTITPTTATICSDSTISISLSTCVIGSTLAWNGSNGTSGSGGIVDAPINNGSLPDTVTYTVTSTSAAGCASSPATMQVVVNPLPVISITPSTPSICTGDSIGLGANGAVTYTWSPSAGLNVSTGDTVVANSPGSTYTVMGVNTYGCKGKTSITVALAPPPVVSVSPPASLVCIGSNTTLKAGGASIYTWQPATGLNVTNDSSVTVTPTITTTYTVTGTSNLGCIDSTTVIVTLATLPLDSFFMTVPSDCNPQQVQFADTLPGVISYLWNFGDSSIGVSPNPLHTYIIPGMYKVILTVTDTQGCIDTASLEETILAEGYVAVPNAFLPEGSTANSFFMPRMLCPDYSGYSFNVYSRWGQLLFQTNDVTQGWDGTYNGAPEQVGVYIYYITFDCGNCPLIKRGNITLLR